MKYFLFLSLSYLALNATTFIDMDDKGRHGSQYIKHLQPTEEVDHSVNKEETEINASTNKEITLPFIKL
jgi:hypothetical protein